MQVKLLVPNTPALSGFVYQILQNCNSHRMKSNNTNARLMAAALSLALDPTFGIHSHETLDTLLNPVIF